MANIFVIDDDPQLLKLIHVMLERGGHQTTLINDPQTGLEQLQAGRPDLLILDVMMPKLSGHELCRQIRATEDIADFCCKRLSTLSKRNWVIRVY